MQRETQRDIILVLHNIRSAQNVGSLFRTADAAGVSKLYLTGYTPAPFDRFGRARRDVAKIALGAQKSVPWEHRDALDDLILKLRNEKIQIIALEQAPDAIDYRKYTSPSSVVLIVGNEIEGLPKEILSQCDVIIEIPMRGTKESLNVSVAAGVALFALQN